MRSIPIFVSLCALACAHSSTSDPAPPQTGSATEPDLASKTPTLPATLTGTLVSTDESRRVLVVTGNLIATMDDAVTSRPEYDVIHDVQCDALFSCRVAANGCQGTITRDTDTSMVVAFVPTQTSATTQDDHVCAAYSGRFEVIEDPLLPHAPNRPVPAGPPEATGPDPAFEPSPGRPRGRVVIGEASTSGDVDIVAARAALAVHGKKLQACYDEYLLDTPGGTGIMRFSLDHGSAAPRAPRPELEESTLPDGALEACVLGVVHGRDRVAPTDGRRARVHYVLSFVGR